MSLEVKIREGNDNYYYYHCTYIEYKRGFIYLRNSIFPEYDMKFKASQLVSVWSC